MPDQKRSKQSKQNQTQTNQAPRAQIPKVPTKADFVSEDGWTVSSSAFARRADKVLAVLLGLTEGANWSRSKVGNLFQAGAVSVNGAVVEKGSVKLHIGDVIRIDAQKLEDIEAQYANARAVEGFAYSGDEAVVEPEDIPIDVVYEDDDVLVVDNELDPDHF